MKSRNQIRNIFVFLLLGFSINFFSPKIIEGSSVGILRYAFLLIAILMSVPYLFISNHGLSKEVRWIFMFQLVSILASYYTWDQGLIQGFRASILFMLWPFFFYLIHVKYPVRNIEKIVMIYGVIYLLCYAYQFMHSGTVLFGNQEEFREERGVTRILFPGGGILFLAAFIAVNKITINHKNKTFYIFFAVAALVATILQVTRQNIAVLLFFYLFHLTRNLSLYKKFIMISAITGGVILLLNSDNAIVRGLQESQQQTSSEGANYIRVLSGSYFLRDFSPNIWTRIFGNGVPYKSADEASVYGDTLFNLKQTEGYYLSDVGIIGFYVMFGVFASLALINLFIKCLRLKIPGEYLYLKYYIWYIVLTAFTSDGVFGINFLFSNVLVVYCLQVCYRRKVVISDPAVKQGQAQLI